MKGEKLKRIRTGLRVGVLAVVAAGATVHASPASAATCSGGATTPVLAIVNQNPDTGYSALIRNSGSAFCARAVTALGATVQLRLLGSVVNEQLFSAVNASSVTGTLTSGCPAGNNVWQGASFTQWAHYPTTDVGTHFAVSSGTLHTQCNRLRNITEEEQSEG